MMGNGSSKLLTSLHLVRLRHAPGVALFLALLWSSFGQPAHAHSGEGFHPESLWSLLRTTLIVALVIAALVGVLWLYRRVKSKQEKSPQK